jgi:DNA polymerase-1
MQKLRSTYAEALPKQINPQTGRIHSSFHQAVASTGRLSSSDPNLQNIPVRTAEGRRIRQAFVGMDGKALLSMDYSQIELRLMAHMADDERLIEAFRQDKDIHQATAAEVFGLTEVSSEQRRAAKAVNFGIIYGISAFGLARQLNLPRHEADDIIKRFFARYPKVKAYMDSRKTFAREQGYVETLSGRRLYLKDIHAKSAPLRQYAERTAINAPLQGTAADIIKLAMIAVQHWLDEHAPSVKMVLQVHDELVFEGEAALLHEIAPQLGEQMVRVMPLSVPLVVDYGIGLNWDAAHQGEARVRG